MRRRLAFVLGFSFPIILLAQTISLSPTITPTLFRYNDQVTVTYDATGTGLAGVTNAWAWVWIPGTNINAKYNINPPTSAADPAKFTKNGSIFTITFKPSDFFNGDISAQTRMGILLKSLDWTNCGTPACQTTDYLVDFWDGSFQIALTSPTQLPLFVNTNDDVLIEAETPVVADYDLYVNDILIDEQNALTSYTYTIMDVTSSGEVELIATSGVNSSQVSFFYILSAASPVQVRPAGIIEGINYDPADDTRVTLCLLAPGKSSIYVRGDFSDWNILPENLMKRDGEFFWLEINGLTTEEEYAYQYLVDEDLWLADPYADKILDPDDQYIPESTYPDLKPFPQDALSGNWYENRFAVFQTGQQPYAWQVTDFEKPAKESMVIYEMLLRDFFDDGDNNYQSLIDTLSYFKTLGVNAIELMPVMEFGGNNSWGYNPQFMFAPDKAYGTKNKLKEFVDVCHQNGIAVILDITLNHQDMPNPFLLMDFNFTTGKPNPTNKWFNVDAKHPYNVFFDMNHESNYTKAYLDTINHYWLNEYKVDGFRFDLSKGFTQNAQCGGSPSNEGCFAGRDNSRIAILKRMADAIWSHTPDAIVILEHFADNSEETELAEYRSGEGKGMLLWGNLNHAYAQNSMGFSENSDFSWIYHGNRNWDVSHVVGYMESHDEERMMYRNTNFGNAAGSYNIKQLSTGLNRAKAASTIFYTIPGPKMLWQFGELGYDFSINHCEDGSINNACRLAPKPIRWDYQEDPARHRLYTHISDLIRLRNEYDIFSTGTATLLPSTELSKQLQLKNNPYTDAPANADEMNAVVVVNFDVIQKNIFVDFPHTGVWYDYYAYGLTKIINETTVSVQLPPGGYKIFTDVEITNPIVVATEDPIPEIVLTLFPNPVSDVLKIESSEAIVSLRLINLQGSVLHPERIGENEWNVREFSSGLYIVEALHRSGTSRYKVIKTHR